MSDLERLPPWQLFITPKIGGLIIVAFDGEAPVAHAVYIHAHDHLNAEPYLYLEMIGVLPDYQGQQIGERIILKSKEFAKSNGYTSVQWTYDPLEGANANLYIRKLGATIIKFYPNFYGQLTGNRHRGSVTDRFLAKLEPDSQPRIHEKMELKLTQQTYRQYENLIGDNPKTIGIEISKDFRWFLSNNPKEAHNMRIFTGQIFEAILNRGYCINGFIRESESNYYIAEKIEA